MALIIYSSLQYADKPLKDLCEELRPFSRLTVEPFLREEMKEKVKRAKS